MSARPPTHGCAEVREEIRERWLSGTLDDAAPLREHIEGCPECRAEADEILCIEASLVRSFRLLGDRTPGPDTSRLEETVRRIRESSPEADLIRKVRRPVRFLLWTAFYLFTLLACLTLAVAVIRALGS